MGMTEDDKRNCCLLEIQETEAKYYRTLEDIEKVDVGPGLLGVLSQAGTQGSGDEWRGSVALSALASGTAHQERGCPPHFSAALLPSAPS